MNLYTTKISQILNISIEEAAKVQEYIDEWFDIDWSEATDGIIKKAATDAFESLQAIKKDGNV